MKYANKGMLIFISWSICYVFTFISSFIFPTFITKIFEATAYFYPLYLAIKGSYMVYKEKEWDIPFLSNIEIFKD